MTMPRASSKRSSQRTRRRPLATASRPSGPRPGQFRSISWPMGEASMRSCSDSIAQLAAALAKAHIDLVNPTKTMTGVIDRWGSGNEGQTYRYAPLSAGLDIVRQTLCKHELAVIQTTEVDQDSGMVMLTTTLAHGSGEWVSASWPVCRTADMSNPKLMGAALTYARRYGLFTLVGIAGEDDLDAPEVTPEAEGGAHSENAKPNGAATDRSTHNLAHDS